MAGKSFDTIKIDALLNEGDTSADAINYYSRVILGDYKTANVVSEFSRSPIEKIRTALISGKFIEAKQLFVNNEKENPLSCASDIELEFERARLYCFHAEFEKCADILTALLLKPELAMVSRLTAHQILSACYFEMNNLEQSITHAKKALNFEPMFPHSEGILFSLTNLLKSLFLTGLTEEFELTQAQIVSSIGEGKYLFNDGLQFMNMCKNFAELSFLRGEYSKALFFAKAGLVISRKQGSDFYFSIFKCLIAIVFDDKESVLANIRKEQQYSQFMITRLYRNQKHDFVPMKSLAKSGSGIEALDEIGSILVPAWDLQFCLKNRKIEKTSFSDQQKLILTSIGNKRIHKEDLYRMVWGGDYYSVTENDSSIRTALLRLKKASGIQIISLGAYVEIKSCLVADF